MTPPPTHDHSQGGTDEALRAWAESRWGLTNVTNVDIDHTEGWAGTDVTPGYPEEITVRITLADGTTRHYDDLRVTTDLIREIIEATKAWCDEN